MRWRLEIIREENKEIYFVVEEGECHFRKLSTTCFAMA